MTDLQINTSRPNLGLDNATVDAIATVLNTVLADEYVLYTKLRNFHWNVTGPQFRSLHLLFEEQYTAIETTIDEVAERLRTYGPYAPGTMAEFIELSRLSEQPGVYPSAHEMVQILADDQEAMVRYLRGDIDKADDLDDDGLEDFLTALLQAHQEQAWMLRTFLQGGSF